MYYGPMRCYLHCSIVLLLTSFQFPTLQTLGESLATILDFLHVKYVIGLGEGAGANVLARFGISNPSRILGLILINCTGSAASVLESFKNKVKYSISIFTKITPSVIKEYYPI